MLQAYNVLAAQIEQTRQLGQKLEAKILDVREVDVSWLHCILGFETIIEHEFFVILLYHSCPLFLLVLTTCVITKIIIN